MVKGLARRDLRCRRHAREGKCVDAGLSYESGYSPMTGETLAGRRALR